MTARTYLRLPIDADQGFPQAFLLSMDERLYRITLYVNVLAEEGGSEKPDDFVYEELPVAGAFMVMEAARETVDGPDVFFRRRLVPNLEYEADELAFLFRKIKVARQNLNGIGAFGSEVIGGVAARWHS
jgi:hypothetical protein